MKNVLDGLKDLNGVLGNINKKYGAHTIARASTVSFAHLVRIPTGVFALDMEMGGGWPKGRVITLVGDEATGKSTLCQLLTANLQHTCKACLQPFGYYTDETFDDDGKVVDSEVIITQDCPCGANTPHVVAYEDFEGHFDPSWATSLGVDVPSLILHQPDNAEQGVDVTNALIRTGQVDAVIVDSVAMMTPSREVETGAEGGRRPDMALIVNQFMRTLQASLNSLGMDNPNKPIVVLVNQFREKVGVMYGDPRTWPGGKGQNFAASLIIVMRAGKRIDIKGNPGGKDDPKVGVELFFSIDKNKTFAPYRKGGFQLFNTDVPSLGVRKGDINNFDQMVEYGVTLGVIAKNGGWYDLQPTLGAEFANPESGKGNFQGLPAVLTFLRQHPDLAYRVREAILSAVKKTTQQPTPQTPADDASAPEA